MGLKFGALINLEKSVSPLEADVLSGFRVVLGKPLIMRFIIVAPDEATLSRAIPNSHIDLWLGGRPLRCFRAVKRRQDQVRQSGTTSQCSYPNCEHPGDPEKKRNEIEGQENNQAYVRAKFVLDKQTNEGGKTAANHEGYVEYSKEGFAYSKSTGNCGHATGWDLPGRAGQPVMANRFAAPITRWLGGAARWPNATTSSTATKLAIPTQGRRIVIGAGSLACMIAMLASVNFADAALGTTTSECVVVAAQKLILPSGRRIL